MIITIISKQRFVNTNVLNRKSFIKLGDACNCSILYCSNSLCFSIFFCFFQKHNAVSLHLTQLYKADESIVLHLDFVFVVFKNHACDLSSDFEK